MTLIDPLEIRLHTLLLETVDNHFIVVTLHQRPETRNEETRNS